MPAIHYFSSQPLGPPTPQHLAGIRLIVMLCTLAMFSLLLFVITIWGKLLMLGLKVEAKSCFLVVFSALSVGLDYIIFEGDALHH